MRIVYCSTSLAHKRVFESFNECPGLNQAIVGPNPHITTSIVPEDYSDFKIPVVNYSNFSKVQNIINELRPEAYVQSDLSHQHKTVQLPRGCKRVYVSHGLVGEHVVGIKKHFKTSVWKGMDLYCGDTTIFKGWIESVSGVRADKIMLNALPQLDIIHDKKYYESYRKRVLEKVCNFRPSKVILFVGFEGKDRIDFKHHNEDFYRTAIYLEALAAKNDWFILMKPRHYFHEMVEFLKCQKWGKKYLENFIKIGNSKHIHIITTTGHIYRYYFADHFVLNGCSTAEVEACCINKPLTMVRTKTSKEEYDPYSTVSSGAANWVNGDGIDELESRMLNIDPNFKNYQDTLIASLGIKFDGQMSKRIQERLISM